MAYSKSRVKIPTNPEDLLKLGKSIYDKHKADATTSPLNTLTDFKWDDEGPKLALAEAKHNEAEELKKKMEAAYKQRDLLMANTTAIIRASRDVLSGINSQNMKRLGDWGFTVDDSPTSAKKP